MENLSFVIIGLIIAILLAIYSAWKLNRAYEIYNEVLKIKEDKNNIQKKELKELEKNIQTLTDEKIALLQEQNTLKQELQTEYENKSKIIEEQLEKYKNNTSYAAEQYVYHLEKEYQKIEQEYDSKKEKINSKLEEVNRDLLNLKETLSAGVQAQLREKEKEEQINFYKINLNQSDINDIKKLNVFKKDFNKPIIINKLIWSTYLQKKTTEMCNQILGTTQKCGIYKITNLITQQAYIGQSVNIGA